MAAYEEQEYHKPLHAAESMGKTAALSLNRIKSILQLRLDLTSFLPV
ncbi:MAG: hypothetical protein ACLTST_12785 [Lachnospiraceae bacterium]